MAIRADMQNARNSPDLKESPLPKIKKFNCKVCKNGVSIANVVSGVTSPPSTPLENEIAKPIENNNSSKEIHGIQIHKNSSVLAQVIELVSLISKILKRSPEILQIITKLKSAEEDNTKTYLLVETILDKK
ncbi:hypothetical protein TNCV_2292421 [Trichonephila clavipes]|nr:hypothetical protein TNCV_2292421 [Trichonephila clavipes]